MNRAELKAHAKASILAARGAPLAVGAVYILPILIAVGYVAYKIMLWTQSAINAAIVSGSYTGFEIPEFPNMTYITLALQAFFLLYSVLSAGFSGYCLRVSRGQQAGFSNLFDFISNRPQRILLISLFTSLAVLPVTLVEQFLGGIPFVAPLCWFASAYISLGFAQAVFLAVDNEERGAVWCLRTSWELMRGRRWELLVLNISFFGWMVFSLFIFPFFYLIPYMQLTLAGYFDLIAHREPMDESAP